MKKIICLLHLYKRAHRPVLLAWSTLSLPLHTRKHVPGVGLQGNHEESTLSNPVTVHQYKFRISASTEFCLTELMQYVVVLKIQVFLEVMTCRLVESYRQLDPEDGGTKLLRNDGNYLLVDTILHPRSLESS